ncbi:TetR/AcrR family transcriptional regulator [Chitinophaga rhizosphaerae]|uniref:TetR/AcrR family transcriptional regulator n=1 Tax=Chitinophaga rhizosphaerae TaxID=1864947 RepID=UPI0013DEFEEA|nr:TetR/AcrR family transcriptional regulator [Chitinophaga rhizosphaerae]
MAGRHKEFDEETALSAATEVFWSQGYESASMEDLLTAMDINKGSMYNTFGNKRGLFVRVLDRFFQYAVKDMTQKFEAHDNPIEGIRDIFRMVTRPADQQDHAKGCFLVNTLGEMCGMDEELATMARNKLLELEAIYLKYLRKGVKNGQVRKDVSPELMARFLTNMWNGMSISRRMYNRKSLEDLVDMQLSLITP